MSVFNGGPYLRPAVDSILGQTLTDLEFIVIDDGSTDGTTEVLASYAARDPRLVVLSNPENLGLTRSLNRGLGAAAGRYIARQDADDLSRPERLAQQVAYLEAHPEVGVVGTLTRAIDAEGRPLAREAFPRVHDNAAIQRRLLSGNCLCHGSVVLRRELLAAGAYDVSYEPAEDYELWLRLAEVSQVVNLEARLYEYRVHDGSVSATRRLEQTHACARALHSALRRRFGSRLPEEHAKGVGRWYLDAALCALEAGQPRAAQQHLGQALAACPRLLADAAGLAQALEPYTQGAEPEAGTAVLRRVFDDLLPRTARLTRQRERLIARLHMREVFQGAKEGTPAQVDAHLWPGLRHDPAWLLNRGVLALLARSVARRGRALARRSE
jgi:hypothetical protein